MSNVLGAGQNVEMASLTQNGSSFGQANDPNAILNECREIGNGIDQIEDSLKEFERFRQGSLHAADSSATNQDIDRMSSEIMNMYRTFAGRIKALKQQP